MGIHSTETPRQGEERPMEGIRVLDITAVLAGPHCATLFAEFGAEVIKIELPGEGDTLRRLGKQVGGKSLFWRVEARNKKTITCDLRKPEGKDLLLRLVKISDVLVENFRPGTLERWDIGWNVLHEVNPGLILARVSAYGQTGPNSGKPGFGRIAQAFGGLTYLAGYPDRAPVTPGTASIADYTSGMYACIGTLMALRYRDKTGQGQYIDVGLYESIFRILEDAAVRYDQTGSVTERLGTGTLNSVPHGHFQCKDGVWIAIACTNDTMWQRLCRAMDNKALPSDPRYSTAARRVENREEVNDIVQRFCLSFDAKELTRLLDEHEVPNGPIYSVEGIFADEHYKARGDIIAVEDPELGPVRMPAVVPRLSLTPGYVEWPGRDLGADNEQVYRDLLDLTEAEIRELREKAVI